MSLYMSSSSLACVKRVFQKWNCSVSWTKIYLRNTCMVSFCLSLLLLYHKFCSKHGTPLSMSLSLAFYAFAFRRRRHYVFGLSVRPSVRPSVRSLKYPLLTCTWVRWSTRPNVTILRHVRPSVRLSVSPSVRPSVRRGFRAFAGECMEGLAWNFICWCILTIFRTD